MSLYIRRPVDANLPASSRAARAISPAIAATLRLLSGFSAGLPFLVKARAFFPLAWRGFLCRVKVRNVAVIFR